MGLQAVNRTFPGKNGLLLTWLMYAFEALLYVLGIYLGKMCIRDRMNSGL